MAKARDKVKMGAIGVVGAGSWGTAISNLLGQSGHRVLLWAHNPSIVEGVNKNRKNPKYLKGLEISDNVTAESELQRVVAGREVVLLVVPSGAMRSVMVEVARYVDAGTIFVSLTKGLEASTLLRMSQLISELAPASKVAVLSGPNHAEEVSQNIPGATVIASPDVGLSARLQDLFMTASFRVYVNRDMIGVEVAGATKNVIAVAAGVSDRLGYGDNAKASLITRGLAEITRLGVAMGAKPMTFSGLAGVGDLIATCTSRYSRNRAIGERLATAQSAEAAQAELGMVAEGVTTVKAVCALGERYGIDMPISRSVYDVIYSNKDPRKCVDELMVRGAAKEELL